MSAETYLRPRPASHTEFMENAAQRYAAAVEVIRAEVEKRFWTLKLDPQLKWHYVEDQVGRRLCEPMTLPSLRGWIQSLPPQA